MIFYVFSLCFRVKRFKFIGDDTCCINRIRQIFKYLGNSLMWSFHGITWQAILIFCHLTNIKI